MELQRLKGTCSMYELCGADDSGAIERMNKTSFYKFLHMLCSDIRYNNVQVIVLNTEILRLRWRSKLKELGFKKVNRYYGNMDGFVETWMLNLTNKVKREFCKANGLIYDDIFS